MDKVKPTEQNINDERKQNIKIVKKLLLDWNYDCNKNKDMTIKTAIKKWETDYAFVEKTTDEQKVKSLYKIWDDNWNDTGRGRISYNYLVDFYSPPYECHMSNFLFTQACEELYDDITEACEYGDKSLYPMDTDKLDFIYWKQTETEFIKLINKYEDLDIDDWFSV